MQVSPNIFRFLSKFKSALKLCVFLVSCFVDGQPMNAISFRNISDPARFHGAFEAVILRILDPSVSGWQRTKHCGKLSISQPRISDPRSWSSIAVGNATAHAPLRRSAGYYIQRMSQEFSAVQLIQFTITQTQRFCL